MTRHVEAFFVFTHVASAYLHSLEIDRLIGKIGIGDFAILAAGLGEPAISEVDTDMIDTLAVWIGRPKKDEVAIDQVVIADLFADFCLVSRHTGDAYAHLSVDIVRQSGAVKGVGPLFCPDIGLVEILVEKFLDILSIRLTGFGWFNNVIVGVVVCFGAATDSPCQKNGN